MFIFILFGNIIIIDNPLLQKKKKIIIIPNKNKKSLYNVISNIKQNGDHVIIYYTNVEK